MKRKFTLKSYRIFLFSILLLSCFRANAVYTTVSLTGFTADVVANGSGAPTTTTTVPFDYVSANPNYVLISQDYSYVTPGPTYYLPTSGIVNSLVTSGLSYQLAAYTGNNSLRLTSTATSGTLTFGNSTLIGDVYVLGAVGGTGTVTTTITINFVGGTTQQFTNVVYNDWFNNTPVAVQGIGRANRATGVIDAAAGSSNPRLYQAKLTLSVANYSKQIASITVLRTAGSVSTNVLNIMAVSVDHQTCLPPQGLAATGTTTTSSNLSWNTVTGASGYQYAVTTSATPPASGTATTGTAYNPTNLNPGTTYYLHVRTDCGGGTFSVWNTFSFVTSPCPTAGAPSVTSTVPGSVTFSWPGAAAPGVTDYQYAVTSSASAPSSWATTAFTSATVGSLTPGNTYYAQVRSNCTSTQALWQYIQFVNPFPPCYTPSQPVVTDTNMHGATITWSTAVNAIAYQYAVTNNPVPPASGTFTTDTFYNATNLTGGAVYYAHVRTHCGTTNFSSWVTTSFSTPANCLPPLTPAVSNLTANSAYIQWNNYPGILNFEYFLDQNPAPPPFPGYGVNYNALAPLNLTSGTTYYFHLRTRCDTFNYSPWITASFTTPTVCTAPGVPVIGNLTQTSAQFNWSAVPGAVSYEYAVTNSSAVPTSGTLITTLSHTETNLTPATPYYFHLRAFCSASDSSQWVFKSFTTLPPLSVSGVPGSGVDIDVFPNPVTDFLNIRLNGKVSGNARLELLNVSGKLVAHGEISDKNGTIDMSALAPGMYFLRYIDKEHAATLKVQKQ